MHRKAGGSETTRRFLTSNRMTMKMTDLSTKSALVVDTGGLFVPIAQRLSRDFGRVYYSSEWLESFPLLTRGILGDGFDDIQRVESPMTVSSKIDSAIFPDSSHSDLQL